MNNGEEQEDTVDEATDPGDCIGVITLSTVTSY